MCRCVTKNCGCAYCFKLQSALVITSFFKQELAVSLKIGSSLMKLGFNLSLCIAQRRLLHRRSAAEVNVRLPGRERKSGVGSERKELIPTPSDKHLINGCWQASDTE